MFLRSGIRIGTLFGIQILLDWSLIVIFLLVSFSLGASAFPAWHPDWSPALSWGVALAAAALFFLSILVHELSHALVAKAYGIPVDRITLFLFGGVANIENDPDSPLKEVLMAGIGPVTSIALGVGFTIAAALLMGITLGPDVDPMVAARHMGPVTTLLFWLGPVNVLLGLFNLLPGFPLDGGRVLRATLWGITRDLKKATRWATSAGRALGWLFILLGMSMALGFHYPLFGGGLLNGMWLAFIGWFLSNAASASYQQLLMRQALQEVPVSSVMRRELPPIVPATAPIATLVEQWVLRSDDMLYPVGDAEHVIGFVHVADIRRVPKSQWQERTVGELVGTTTRLATAHPDENAFVALQRLGREDADALAVVDDDRLVGLLRRADVLRWVSLQSDEGTGWRPTRRGTASA